MIAGFLAIFGFIGWVVCVFQLFAYWVFGYNPYSIINSPFHVHSSVEEHVIFGVMYPVVVALVFFIGYLMDD